MKSVRVLIDSISRILIKFHSCGKKNDFHKFHVQSWLNKRREHWLTCNQPSVLKRDTTAKRQAG